MRTFIAVNLPEEIRADFREHLEHFRTMASGISWVPAQNVHITLKFLGDVAEQDLGGVCSAVEKALAGFQQFSIQLGGFGAFPNFNRPRVFWVGITRGTEKLRDLARAVDQHLLPLGFEKGKRKFSAHLTLGRIKRPGNYDQLRQAAERADYSSATFAVPSVEVMKSVLSPRGALYSVWKSISLTA